eukprot:290016-Pleurochrysis_carterae.AAC.3
MFSSFIILVHNCSLEASHTISGVQDWNVFHSPFTKAACQNTQETPTVHLKEAFLSFMSEDTTKNSMLASPVRYALQVLPLFAHLQNSMNSESLVIQKHLALLHAHSSCEPGSKLVRHTGTTK